MIANRFQVSLRPFRDADLDDVIDYASQPAVAQAANFPVCTTLGQGMFFLRRLQMTGRAVVLTTSQKVIGNVCLYPIFDPDQGIDEQKVELGYALNQDYWKQGLGTQAVALAIIWAQEAGYRVIEAYVYQDNIASQRVLEKNGFKRLPAPEISLNTGLQIGYQLNI